MRIRADKRSIDANRIPGVDDRVAGDVAALRELQLRLARDLAKIDENAHFVFSGCASVVEYGVKLGLSAAEVRTLSNLGKTLAVAPEAEPRIRSGKISVEAAAVIGRVFARPEIIRPGDDWLLAAASNPIRMLRRKVKKRFEQHAQGEIGIEQISVHITSKAREDFERARDVASQKAGTFLTDGQTFTRVVNFYLDENDPLRKKGGTRRVGDTSAVPRSRYVPAQVQRAIYVRANGTCEVPTCDHRLGLELAHRTPHRSGSGREIDDLGLLCRRHHVLYDAGRIGWPLSRGVPQTARIREDINAAQGAGNGSSAASDSNGTAGSNGSGVVRERAPPFCAAGRFPPVTPAASTATSQARMRSRTTPDPRAGTCTPVPPAHPAIPRSPSRSSRSRSP